MYRLRVAWAAALSGVVPVAFAGWSLAQPSPDTGAELSFGRWVFEVVGVAGAGWSGRSSGPCWSPSGRATSSAAGPRPGLGVAWACGLQSYGYQGVAAGWPAAGRRPRRQLPLRGQPVLHDHAPAPILPRRAAARPTVALGRTAVVVVSPVQIGYFMIEEAAGQVVANVAVLLWIGMTLTAWGARSSGWCGPGPRSASSRHGWCWSSCRARCGTCSSPPSRARVRWRATWRRSCGPFRSSSRPWRWRWGCCGTGCWGSSRCCGGAWCTGR